MSFNGIGPCRTRVSPTAGTSSRIESANGLDQDQGPEVTAPSETSLNEPARTRESNGTRWTAVDKSRDPGYPWCNMSPFILDNASIQRVKKAGKAPPNRRIPTPSELADVLRSAHREAPMAMVALHGKKGTLASLHRPCPCHVLFNASFRKNPEEHRAIHALLEHLEEATVDFDADPAQVKCPFDAAQLDDAAVALVAAFDLAHDVPVSMHVFPAPS